MPLTERPSFAATGRSRKSGCRNAKVARVVSKRSQERGKNPLFHLGVVNHLIAQRNPEAEGIAHKHHLILDESEPLTDQQEILLCCQKGLSFKILENYPCAINWYEKALKKAPEDREIKANLAQVWHCKAKTHQEGEQHFEAITCLKKAVTLDPDRELFRQTLSEIYFSVGKPLVETQPRKAQFYFRQAIACCPLVPLKGDIIDLLNSQAKLAEDAHSYAQALEYYEIALELFPKDNLTLGNLFVLRLQIATLMWNEGQLLGTIEQYEKALAIFPNNAEAKRDLLEAYEFQSDYHLLKNEYREAIAIYDKARLLTENPEVWIEKTVVAFEALGNNYVLQQDYNSAIAALKIFSVKTSACRGKDWLRESKACSGRCFYDCPKLYSSNRNPTKRL